MIITLSGITGVGKSYYENLLVQNLEIENMVIYNNYDEESEQKMIQLVKNKLSEKC